MSIFKDKTLLITGGWGLGGIGRGRYVINIEIPKNPESIFLCFSFLSMLNIILIMDMDLLKQDLDSLV